MNKCIIYLLLNLLIYVQPACAYYQNSMEQQNDNLLLSIKPDDSKNGDTLSVLENRWDNNTNAKERIVISYKSTAANSIDQINLMFSTRSEYASSYQTVDESLSNLIYSNLMLKRMIDEYKQIQNEQMKFRKQLGSVLWFSYDFNIAPKNPKKSTRQNKISRRRQHLSNDYVKVIKKIKSRSSYFDMNEEILDAVYTEQLSKDDKISITEKNKKLYGLKKSDNYQKFTTNIDNKGDAKYLGNADKGLRQKNVKPFGDYDVKPPWIVTAFVAILSYIMANKIEMVIYVMIIFVVISFLTSARPK